MSFFNRLWLYVVVLFKQRNTPLPFPPPQLDNKLAVELQQQLPLKDEVPGKREGGETPSPVPSLPTASSAPAGRGAERSAALPTLRCQIKQQRGSESAQLKALISVSSIFS